MSDVERETYLHRIRAEAWKALIAAKGDPAQVFAAAVEVYERELREHFDASDADFAGDFEHLTRARTNVQQMIDAGVTFGTAESYGLQAILADLDAVLGPDLLREADPSGEILKPLPFAERKRMLDALDSVQKVIDERGGGQPPYIVIVEDEMGPLLEEAAMRKRGVRVVTERDAAAERMSDYLTQLGVDPDETFEGDPRTTAQVLADVALATDGVTAVEVGSPEHQAAERVHVAEMSRRDVARGEI